ncbi:PREDICTED: uncharacterized protein LOC104753707 [Camelina sativa]|uniref:Uncharacterized protein LOC104753707 n=1 Tax=Camelina sativa TaxID=90675 RepID=A0ABM0WPJ7_CAMSA|nr:PREDICTED: uncharacterized protein LOC104753707 [Camelina sativa]
MSNVTKLMASKFLMWHRQVRALVAGYGLAGHLDGTTAAPAMTLTTDGVTAANPAYNLWERQDQLLYSSPLGVILVELQPILSTVSTSAQIWSLLFSTYAKPSGGHIKQLREQIKQWKKGTKPIDEYFQGLTARFDHLATLGKPYEHEEQIDGRDTPPSMPEIHEKLINFELKLQSQISASSFVPLTANAAFYKSPGHHNNSRNQNRFSSRGNHHNSSRGSQGRGYQGCC